MGPLSIREVSTTIVDLPLRRRHTFSTARVELQSYVIVRVRSDDGQEGVGEGAAPGGAWWGTATVESIAAVIDRYLGPALLGSDPLALEEVDALLRRTAPAERSARAALNMAVLDLAARSLGIPAHQLLGGRRRSAVPVAWALSADEADAPGDEVDERLGAGHRRFKLKAGAGSPAHDVARVLGVLEALDGRADLIIDPNGAWDELTAREVLRELSRPGVALMEQPVPGWNHQALARLTGQGTPAIMADEALHTPHDAAALGGLRAGDVWSLKPQKSGGALALRRVAAVAGACGVRLYGGTMLETSIGTAASLHMFCSLPTLAEGCELVGPLLLAEDVVRAPVEYRDGNALLPEAVGLGVELDEDRLASFARPTTMAQVGA